MTPDHRRLNEERSLPQVQEELKNIEVKSIGNNDIVNQSSPYVRRNSRQSRRSVQPDAAEDLKSKVSRMMENHSQLVDDLKSNKKASSKRQSVYSGKDGAGQAIG